MKRQQSLWGFRASAAGLLTCGLGSGSRLAADWWAVSLWRSGERLAVLTRVTKVQEQGSSPNTTFSQLPYGGGDPGWREMGSGGTGTAELVSSMIKRTKQLLQTGNG